MRDFISVEEEVTADAKEGFSKNYSFPTGRDTNDDDYQKEGDDDEDEMTHGEHSNDVTNEKDNVFSDEAQRVNKVLSQLDDLDVDKDAADKDMAGIKSKNDIISPEHSANSNLSTDDDGDDDALGSDERAKISGESDQPNADSNDQQSDDEGDKLDEHEKKSVKAFIRKLLLDAMQKRK